MQYCFSKLFECFYCQYCDSVSMCSFSDFYPKKHFVVNELLFPMTSWHHLPSNKSTSEFDLLILFFFDGLLTVDNSQILYTYTPLPVPHTHSYRVIPKILMSQTDVGVCHVWPSTAKAVFSSVLVCSCTA